MALSLAPVVLAGNTAAAEDPIFVEWSSLTPTLTAGYDPTTENECKRGSVKCVDAVIREMTRRFDRLAAECDHDAVFALTYLRTTEEYRRTIEDPNFFSDASFVNHEDAVFAEYYFDAFDAWNHGDVAATPPAWQVALAAADQRQVTGSGNLFLGMSAHINRDLPFVLAGIGLVKPDGSSRKPDHDKVNQFLNRVTEPVLAEAAQRLDPTIDDGDVPGTSLDATATLQLVVSWREEAWRNAERLANAATALERAQVAQSIEDFAYAEAVSMRESLAYGPLRNSADRDAYCTAHWDGV
ncbi:MAG: hypothetical protein HYU28_04475 [Actinobacteria bacterium]|nr:hypothetical protein [Actinomycetota bacterium]